MALKIMVAHDARISSHGVIGARLVNVMCKSLTLFLSNPVGEGSTPKAKANLV